MLLFPLKYAQINCLFEGLFHQHYERIVFNMFLQYRLQKFKITSLVYTMPFSLWNNKTSARDAIFLEASLTKDPF